MAGCASGRLSGGDVVGPSARHLIVFPRNAGPKPGPFQAAPCIGKFPWNLRPCRLQDRAAPGHGDPGRGNVTACSEANRTYTGANSAGCPARPNGVSLPRFFTFSSGIVAGISGVQIGSGATLGMGPDTASDLLIAAGDNPEPIRPGAAWARLCKVGPEVSN